MEERRSLKHAVDPSWGESVERQVTLPVIERRTELQVKRTNTGKRMGVPEKKTVEVRRTLKQEVLELTLVDEPIPPVPERRREAEARAVLRPEDVLGRLPTEPDATASDASGTAREELPGEGPAREPATPREQAVPAPGLSAVLQSRTEGVITVGEGEKSRQVQYEGPRFEIRGSVLFDIEQPVDPSPKIPKIDEQGRPVVQQGDEQFRAVQRIGPGRDYQYPEDQLADQVRQEGSSQ